MPKNLMTTFIKSILFYLKKNRYITLFHIIIHHKFLSVIHTKITRFSFSTPQTQKNSGINNQTKKWWSYGFDAVRIQEIIFSRPN
jgi:hypothetical protein